MTREQALDAVAWTFALLACLYFGLHIVWAYL